MLYEICNSFKKKKIKQIASLYTSMLLGIFFSISISAVNTRLLGAQQYGNLKFLQNLFEFIKCFLTFGLFVSGSRLLAQRINKDIKHELIGNLLLYSSAISIIATFIIFSFSYLEEGIFDNKLGKIIRLLSPLSFVLPFTLCMENIMQGDNRIYSLSMFRLGPKALYLLVVILYNHYFTISLTSALSIHFGSFAFLIIIMILRIKPKIVNIKKNGLFILKENRSYGFNVYIGAIANVGTVQLAGLTIGYFLGNSNVGFYSLALAMTIPLAMIPSVVGTAFFKDFANCDSIPKKATLITMLFTLTVLIIYIIFIKKIVIFLYSTEYIIVVSLSYILSIGSILRGFGDYFNRFLGSHGCGRELRNVAFINGLSNILGYFFLVYMFGLKGAVFTKVISDLIYLTFILFYYQRFRSEISVIAPRSSEKHGLSVV